VSAGPDMMDVDTDAAIRHIEMGEEGTTLGQLGPTLPGADIEPRPGTYMVI